MRAIRAIAAVFAELGLAEVRAADGVGGGRLGSQETDSFTPAR